jgi:hypothetical protein
MKLQMIAIIMLLGANALATSKVNNGFGDYKVVYTCEEKNPADPANPMVLVLDELRGKKQLKIAYKNSSDKDVSRIEVVKNNEIRCIVACDIYDGVTAKISFGVTLLGKQAQGLLSVGEQESISFSCSQSGR